jgi:perosamine synthetase
MDRQDDAVASLSALANKDELIRAYEQAFSGMLGPDVRTFAFWKGRVALYAILQALGVGAGDEVLIPGFTCFAVPNAVRFLGARPVYADISIGSYNLDFGSAAQAISPRTRALIIQHTLGFPAPLEELLALAKRHNLAVIEDCAHSLGSAHRGKSLGTFGDAAFFSSQWSKPYTTGLGGVAITRDRDLAIRLARVQQAFAEPSLSARWRLSIQYQFYQRFFTPQLYWLAQGALRGVGRMGLAVSSYSAGELAGSRPHDHEWRMAHPQCLAGLRQLEGVPAGIRHRRMLAARYDAGLRDAGWPIATRDEENVLLRYPVMVQNKQELLRGARHTRVELGSWFDTPLHPAPLSQHAVFGYAPGQCPNSEAAARRIVNLPLHQRVTVDEADRVLEFFLKHAARP